MRRIGRVAIGHSGAVLFVVAATVVAAHVQAADAGSRHVTQPLAQSGIARAATSTYVDGVGDAAPGAVDLDYVIVTDVGGQVGIGLTYASGGCLKRGDSLDIDIDADRQLRPATTGGSTPSCILPLRTSPPCGSGSNKNISGRYVQDARMQGRPRSCARQRIRDRYSHRIQLQRDAELGRPSRGSYFFAVELQARESGSTAGAATGADSTPRATHSWPSGSNVAGRTPASVTNQIHREVGKACPAWRDLYRTRPRLGSPHVVNVACWSKEDWPSVLQSATGPSDQPGSITVAFWYPRQPRWLHISPRECADVQGLMTDRRLNGRRAYGLTTVLHERVHADGYRDEARTNCYAVQLVRSFARTLGFAPLKAAELERLAVKRTRAVAQGVTGREPLSGRRAVGSSFRRS